MSLMAQAEGATEGGGLGVTDNRVLDEYTVPFGEWMGQAKDWINSDLDWLLAAIKWPFATLNELLVRDIMQQVSWFWIVVAFFVVGTLARNIKVGVFAGVGIAACGLLGNDFWLATIETIGFVVVAVLVCIVIGIPLGVACGRFDAFWQAVRPVLDAMQVVHAFVYMLPFIAFFGIGNVGATIVTMFFALPPLVRLTNLGIRQVPADVVEASRAYGAPEWRVLIDVQLPLARAAIMAGINQTLLLAMSMLGVAAIMGAEGLGGLLFFAISSQSVTDAAAGGLAFYLVAVVFDRMSQPEGTDTGGLLRRMRLAWTHRRTPESLLPADDPSPAESDASESVSEVSLAPLETRERRPMLVAAAGGVAAAVSVFLTWSSGAGFLSSFGRAADERLAGESLNGLSASGGSWFGILVVVLALFVVVAVGAQLIGPGRGARWLAADGAVIASLALFVTMTSYLLAAAPDFVVGQSTGVGPWVALLGAVVASAGSLLWIRAAPYSPTRPLSDRIGWGRVVIALFAMVVLGVGAVSAWSFDERERVVIDAETQALLDELGLRAEENPAEAGVIAAEMAELSENLESDRRLVVDGVSSQGAGLGIWVFVAGLAGLAAAMAAAGVFGRNESRQWQWSSITAGIGAGAACVGIGWIFTHVRSGDDDFVSGVGAFLAVAGGLVLVSTAAAMLREFRRAKVYADDLPVQVQ